MEGPLFGLAAMTLPSIRRVMNPVVIVAGVVLVIISLVVDSRHAGYEGCGFYRLVHRPCPACGLTRSVRSICIADFDAAWNWHPFGFVAAPLLALFVVMGVVPGLRRRLLDPLIERHERTLTYLFWSGVLALFLFGSIRAFRFA